MANVKNAMNFRRRNFRRNEQFAPAYLALKKCFSDGKRRLLLSIGKNAAASSENWERTSISQENLLPLRLTIQSWSNLTPKCADRLRTLKFALMEAAKEWGEECT
jgi:hypothetical protein